MLTCAESISILIPPTPERVTGAGNDDAPPLACPADAPATSEHATRVASRPKNLVAIASPSSATKSTLSLIAEGEGLAPREPSTCLCRSEWPRERVLHMQP